MTTPHDTDLGAPSGFRESVSSSLFLHEHGALVDFARLVAARGASLAAGATGPSGGPGRPGRPGVMGAPSAAGPSAPKHGPPLVDPPLIVVCERKEDLLGVRAMLTHLARRERSSAGLATFAGVTMYTLDSFAETLMKTLALTPDPLDGGAGGLLDPALKAAFRKPFLDVVTQEKLLRVLLLRLRFSSADALSTAKQLLTLVDVAFPEDENLFKLLLETQQLEKGLERNDAPGRKGNTPRAQDLRLTETAFKQILCAYQGAQALLPQFSRLQRLVLDYLELDFRSHVLRLAAEPDFARRAQMLSFPDKFLRSHLLWFAAPEYGDPVRKPAGYRPGNFQSSLVDPFRDAIFHARSHLSGPGWETLHARCYLPTAEPKGAPRAPLSHVEARIVSPRRRLWERATAGAASPAQGELHLLADFPLDEERVFDEASHGPQPLHEELLVAFARGELARDPDGGASDAGADADRDTTEGAPAFGDSGAGAPDDAPFEERATDTLARSLESLWEELAEAVSLLDYFSGDLESRARTYGLSYLSVRDQDFLELWKSHCHGESSRVGRPHPVAALPRALSYFALSRPPDRIVALGRPHAPRAPSFIVKILNDAMASLARKGVAIELPATDESYRGFYTWLARLGIPLQFWIPSLQDFEGFPDHLSHKRGVRVTTDVAEPRWRHEGTLAARLAASTIERAPPGLGPAPLDGRVVDTRWAERLRGSAKETHGARPSLGVTQFERYVTCPMKFYLIDVLRLDESEEDFTSAPPRETGEAVHAVAERFVSLFKLAGPLEAPPRERNAVRVRYLESVRALLSDPRFLVDAPEPLWRERLGALTDAHVPARVAAVASGLLDAILENVFHTRYDGPSRLRGALAVETVKRAFLRLIMTEQKRLVEEPDLQPGGFAEETIELRLGDLRLKGRVDRIDTSPRGYHMIDYKTSKVPKTDSKMVFLPEQARGQRTRLSAQGALYALAWSERNPEIPVVDFALYRLKNLDEDADVLLRADLGGETLHHLGPLQTRLRDVYAPIADALSAGEFAAGPLQTSTCNFCPGFHSCPVPRRRAAEAT